ncbi:phospholipase D-like domain-containing protein [Mastigocladopsis repens]|uniref:phospholipase D-like domain-containing protein n=1 Tax=Mastigocladopsis repens TaxID=221287 RepID=UPI001E3A7F86|nr:phospholipase D-like domain-containing protein [Mastigocladopsis repens]
MSGVVLVTILKPSPKVKLVQPLPQDPAVKVYFNHNPVSSYQDPYRQFTRKGDNLEQQIIDAINQAQSTVDLAVMEFRLPKVAEALTLAHQRRVKVRVLIDNKYNKTLAEYTQEELARMSRHDKQAYEELKRYPADALAMLRSNKIEIKDDTSSGATKGSGLMHHKFVVIDGKTTIISSGNLTASDMHGDFGNFDTRGNPNNIVVVPDNSQIATTFTNEFNYMWQGLFKSHKPKRYPVTIPVGTGTITINFSPASRKDDIATTSNGIISSYLQQAKKSVHIAVFVYSAQQISDTLGRVHDQGVEDIKVLIDPDFFRQAYSKAYDAMGVCPRPGKKNSLIKVKPWRKPITTVGFPTSSIGDRGVHSKMAILDQMLVITGSHNWSDSGNYLNDETLMFIQNPMVATHYEQEFSRLYQTAKLGLKTLASSQKCELVNSKNTYKNSLLVNLNTYPLEE